ncbi:MAG: DUF3014 domain-containing protein [Acidobacteria bacterium]|nr:MAG: DUF3014 domain-containing protein [Acidobacteriota bacterium]REK00149.1 MAG: DUF3014 domain-containing protein [Acidobacteriota bacterium]
MSSSGGERPDWDRLELGGEADGWEPSFEERGDEAGDGLYDGSSSPDPLVADSESDPTNRGALRGALALLLVLAVAGVGIWLWLRDGDALPPELAQGPPPDEPAPVAEAPQEPLPEAEPQPDEELPPLDASDEMVRRLVASLSSHPRMAQLLVTDRLIEKAVRVVANVAYDENPSGHLPSLAPASPFVADRVEVEGGVGERFLIGEETTRRYDAAVAMFTSLDSEGTARLHRRLRPLLDEAYADLGLPGSFADAVRRAAARLRATPDVAQPLLERTRPRTFQFVDPRLEELAEGQKILLRMGSENRRRLLEKMEDLLAASGLD